MLIFFSSLKELQSNIVFLHPLVKLRFLLWKCTNYRHLHHFSESFCDEMVYTHFYIAYKNIFYFAIHIFSKLSTFLVDLCSCCISQKCIYHDFCFYIRSHCIYDTETNTSNFFQNIKLFSLHLHFGMNSKIYKS